MLARLSGCLPVVSLIGSEGDFDKKHPRTFLGKSFKAACIGLKCFRCDENTLPRYTALNA
jgi:hypothetical protein